MQTNAFHQLHQVRLARSTRPFAARGAKLDRCPSCQTGKQFCICSARPKPFNNISFLLLLSESEILKPSNTGRLIADVFSDTYAYEWSRTQPEEGLINLLQDPKYLPVVLFPAEYVEDKSRLSVQPQTLAGSDQQLLLILLDGSWREARRMFRKSPYLNRLPVISIQPSKLSEYIMRKSANPSHLSTAEVTSVALEQLGLMKHAESLSLWFETFREAYLLSKSRGAGDPTRSALHKMLDYRTKQHQ